MSDAERLRAWGELQALKEGALSLSLADAFASNPNRAEELSWTLGTTLFDLSKNLITDEILDALLLLATSSGLEEARSDLFGGKPVNSTEKRSVFHVALRGQQKGRFLIDGKDVLPDVREVLQQIRAFVENIHSGQLTGYTSRRFTDVVNVGIGGSDLGPRMVTEALHDHRTGHLNCHFVSNVDAAHITSVLERLDPETTLFVVASKTFTTQETMTNATIARQWITQALAEKDAIADHFVAVSTNRAGVTEFGISPERMFQFWDWVGGRYSLWSAIGLPIALSIGADGFEALLRGANKADEHFKDTPMRENIPVITGLLQVWYASVLGAESMAVLPYDQRLARMPAYLQQADMESNGKSVKCSGKPVETNTGPVIWGEPGTNGQHAFYQLLHQGTRLIPAEFLAAATPAHSLLESHEILLSNFFAQPEALMRGRTIEEATDELIASGHSQEDARELAPHKVFPGNRPTTSILYKTLDPSTLGMLIALYEHRIFVAGVIWGINSFDQWGVELGKVLANKILPELSCDEATTAQTHDPSTAGLIAHYKRLR